MVENFAEDLKIGKNNTADSAREQLINQLAREMISSKDTLAPAAAPNSLIARYGLVTLKGVGNVPQGMLHAVEENIKNPLQTLGMVAGAAAMGATLKTILPETGPAGKIAGLAIGAYFTYKSAEPFIESYKLAGQAKTMEDLDVAAVHLGDVGGSFIVNSAIAAVGYKLGAAGAERVLLSEKLDGFANAKQAFWDGVGDKTGKITGRLSDAMGFSSSGESIKTANSMSLDTKMGDVQKFLPSEKLKPRGIITGNVPADSPMDITVQLKSKATDLTMERHLKRIALGRQAPLTDTQFTEKFGASQESLNEVVKFANDNGLKITESDLRSGRVVLSGNTSNFENAFKTSFKAYDLNGTTIRGREGALFVPNSMAQHIEGIFGMDDRPQARTYSVKLSDIQQGTAVNKLSAASDAPQQPAPQPTQPAPQPPAGDGPGRGPVLDAKKSQGYLPNEVADAYNFPKDTSGKGQSVAIIQLGGGIDMANEAAYYKAHGLKMPEIKVIEVNGAKSKPGMPGGADAEVSLDSQVIGAVAPDAKQNIIFAPNSDRGFIDAITRATFPEKGESPNQAISISWGAPMESWTDQGKRGMNLAFKKAALKGISIFAASGDDGAINNSPSKTFQVDYPAADPYVTGTGGTRLVIQDGKIVSEVAWNNGAGRGAGGGGISPDEIPDFQKDMKLPPNPQTNVLGRGVPDVAGNADPVTGYKIRVGGAETIMGGTSAVAPLYAALALRLNEGLGQNKQVGYLNPFFYKNGLAGKAPFFNDITSGNNNGYNTSSGWDPVTGWGSLNGEKLLASLKGEGGPLSMRVLSMVPQELKNWKDVTPIPMNVHAPNDNQKAGLGLARRA